MTTRSQISLALAFTLCAFPALATAEPYWIAYEGNDFPENEGWDRHWGVHVPPGDPNSVPERSIDDGVFVLDTTCDIWLNDYYQIHRQIDPAPGELFVAEWRVAVDELLVYWDAKIAFARDNPPGHAAFSFGVDQLLIDTGEDILLPIAPGPHSYRFESWDMDQFELYLDGALAHQGVFESESLLQSYVTFGNGTLGASSLSRWDYVRFGAIPEPTSFLLAIIGLASVRHRTGRASSGGPGGWPTPQGWGRDFLAERPSSRSTLTPVDGDLATIAAWRRARSDVTSPAMCTSRPSPATTA
jgi:hypothetical protein